MFIKKVNLLMINTIDQLDNVLDALNDSFWEFIENIKNKLS